MMNRREAMRFAAAGIGGGLLKQLARTAEAKKGIEKATVRE